LNLWENTVVIFTGDHGEMNAAHRMTQKGAIHFDEAAVVNLTVCVPGGEQGERTAAVGSHLDPGEMENLAHPEHPKHDPALIERMLRKLHRLVQEEIGEERAPFDLDMFGTREVKYRKEEAAMNSARLMD
jgi:arylsulfatase A-like enzyme